MELENLSHKVIGKDSLPYSIAEIVLLTGLTGIHPELAREDNIDIKIYPYKDCIRIELSSTLVEELHLVIYFTSKYIDNQYIRKSNTPTTGLAARWVGTQSAYAKQQGYKTLKAFAYKDDSGTTLIFCGYIVWGKTGYLLAGNSIGEFNQLMQKFNMLYNTLYGLISTEAGLKFWETEGFGWEAEFDLSEGSESFRILGEYLKRKGIPLA